MPFARGKDCAAGDAELVVAANALELATGGNVVGLGAAATRAHGLAFRFGPTHLAEGLIGHIFAHAENLLEAQRSGGGGEEEVLHCHYIRYQCIAYNGIAVLLSMANVSYMMALPSQEIHCGRHRMGS